MSEKIRIRREQVKRLMMLGAFSQEKAAKELKVNRATIIRDIKAIQEEMREMIKTIDLDTMLSEILLKMDERQKEAWKLFVQGKNEHARINALRLTQNIDIEKIKVLQSLGIIRELAPAQREPITIEFKKPYWEKDEPKS